MIYLNGEIEIKKGEKKKFRLKTATLTWIFTINFQPTKKQNDSFCNWIDLSPFFQFDDMVPARGSYYYSHTCINTIRQKKLMKFTRTNMAAFSFRRIRIKKK